MTFFPRPFHTHYRPILVMAVVLGLLLWGCLLPRLSAPGQVERNALATRAPRLTTGASLKPGLAGNPAKETGNRMLAALAASPPESPPGLGARPGLPGSPPPHPTHPRPPVHTLRVWVTGYDLSGITASGVLAGPGGCAVDPSVIPLGTTITIEGIGRCRANDTGPAVVGATVDVWVPDAQTAYQLTGGYTIHY